MYQNTSLGTEEIVSALPATLRHLPVLITKILRNLIDGIIPRYCHCFESVLSANCKPVDMITSSGTCEENNSAENYLKFKSDWYGTKNKLKAF
jgi:hypothetical protein